MQINRFYTEQYISRWKSHISISGQCNHDSCWSNHILIIISIKLHSILFSRVLVIDNLCIGGKLLVVCRMIYLNLNLININLFREQNWRLTRKMIHEFLHKINSCNITWHHNISCRHKSLYNLKCNWTSNLNKKTKNPII